MNVSRNLSGLAMILVLAGCGDRGQFKSRTYTPPEKIRFCNGVAANRNSFPQQIVEACAEMMVKLGQGQPQAAQNTPVIDSGLQEQEQAAGENPGGEATPIPGTPIAVPGKDIAGKKEGEGQAQGAVDQKVNTEKAAAKNFFEPIDNRDKFIQTVTQILEIGDSAFASSIVKGMDILVEDVSGTLAINIDAVIMFEGKARYLMLPWEAIVYDKTGKVTPLTLQLREFENGADISGKLQDKVVLEAVCSDEKCQNIYVRLQISVDGKVAIAAALVSFKNGTYDIVKNNFARKSFEDGVKESYKSSKVDLSKLKDTSKNNLPTSIKNRKSGKQEEAKPEGEQKPETKTPEASGKPTNGEKEKPAPGVIAEGEGKTAKVLGQAAAGAGAKSSSGEPNIDQEIAEWSKMGKQGAGAEPNIDQEIAEWSKMGKQGAGAEPNIDQEIAEWSKMGKQTAKPQPQQAKPVDDQNTKTIEALKKEGVEAHYMAPPQAEKSGETQVVQKASATKDVKSEVSDEELSLWQGFNTFAEEWLNF